MSGYRVWPHEGCLPEAVPGTLHLHQTASTIICHDPAGIPPMLETGESAAASLHALLADDATFGEHAEARWQYRGLISAARGPDILCLLHEAVLRRLRGDKNMRHAQFLVLAMLRDDERIQVRVVPEALEYLLPRNAFSTIRCSDGREVVVAPLRTATLVLDGDEHLAAYRDLVAMLDQAALSPGDSAELMMSLPVLPEPVPVTTKDFADEVKRAPVAERSGPVQECFRTILRALAGEDRNLTLDQISAVTELPRSNTTNYVQVLLHDRMVTSMQGRHAPDGTVLDAPCKSYTVTAHGLAYVYSDDESPRAEERDPNSVWGKPIAERSTIFQSQLRAILWVTIDEVADVAAFRPSEAGQRLGALFKEKMVALLVGDHKLQGSPVRDSRVKSYAITSAGLAYLRAAPPGERRKLNIEDRRVQKGLLALEERRAQLARMNSLDRTAEDTPSHQF